MENILISICCITYNQEKYITEMIDSLLGQKTEYKFEIIIYDDASKDKTREIIKKYEKKYPEIIKGIYPLENQFSKGVIPVIYCFAEAKGKYIAICEGDDFWIDERKLQKQVEFLEQNDKCVLVVHSAYKIYEDGVVASKQFRPFNYDRVVETREILSEWLFPTNSLVFRKNNLLGRSEFPFSEGMPDGLPCGDYPLTVFLALQGDVYYMDSLMSVYRLNSIGSISSMIKKNKKLKESRTESLIQLLSYIDEYSMHKYNKEIYSFILKLEFEKYKNNGNLKTLKELKYIELYSAYSKWKKVLIPLRKYIPSFFELLNRLKEKKTYYNDRKIAKKKGVKFSERK